MTTTDSGVFRIKETPVAGDEFKRDPAEQAAYDAANLQGLIDDHVRRYGRPATIHQLHVAGQRHNLFLVAGPEPKADSSVADSDVFPVWKGNPYAY